jgi:hypothetical protein
MHRWNSLRDVNLELKNIKELKDKRKKEVE